MTDGSRVERVLADAHRDEWGIVLAATVRVARDLDLAEECVQEAYADALRQWRAHGIPRVPAAWLTTAAKRRAIDALRREQTLRAKLPLLIEPDDGPADEVAQEPTVPDERLRLMLLCCHPALPDDARTALTLRLVCGVGTADIARVFLVSEPTMAARLTRAKKKITGAGIPYRLPPADQLPERLALVLDTVFLLLTAGHVARDGERIERSDFVDEALRLSQLLHRLLPRDPEVAGLLALATVIAARRSSRTDPHGRLLTLGEQDRTAWDHDAIEHASRITLAALPDRTAGRFALQAAIAVVHAQATSEQATDWPQILGLYDHLLAIWPTPVVRLNRVVVLTRLGRLDEASAEIDGLADAPELAHDAYLHAVHADLLERSGRHRDAAARFLAAAEATANTVEADALLRRAAAATRRYASGRTAAGSSDR